LDAARYHDLAVDAHAAITEIIGPQNKYASEWQQHGTELVDPSVRRGKQDERSASIKMRMSPGS
jgi:hypothetical protein